MFANQVVKWQPHLVVGEDSGGASELTENLMDMTAFPGHVERALDKIFSVPGYDAAVVLATTMPFEDGLGEPRNGDNCQLMASACNWAGHNRVLVERAEQYPDRAFVADVAADSCFAYGELADDPIPLELTYDGIHPTNNGHVFYALSLFKSLGGIESDVLPAEILELLDEDDDDDPDCNPELGAQPTLSSVQLVHDLVFSAATGQSSSICLVNAECTSTSLATDCIDFCDARPGRPDHQCQPYFACEDIPPAKAAPCDDDGLFCTKERCANADCASVSGPCANGSDSCREGCDEEADSCTLVDSSSSTCSCTEDPCVDCVGLCDGAGTCGVAEFCPVCPGPMSSCKIFDRAKVALRSHSDAADGFVRISANRGEATSVDEFGILADQGVDTDALTVCIYDDEGSVVWYGAMPKNECDEASCWGRREGAAGSGRLRYENRFFAPGNQRSIDKVMIKTSPYDGRTTLNLRALGDQVMLPDNLAGSSNSEVLRWMTVQVLTTAGLPADQGCWQADVEGIASHSSSDGLSDFSGETPRP